MAGAAGAHRFAAKRLAQPWMLRSADAKVAEPLPPVKLEAPKLVPTDSGQSRILLDDAALSRLRDVARRGGPAWKRLAARCAQQSRQPMRSGYQAFEWADAVASLSLCWKATGQDQYGRLAVAYLEALLDDRFQVGDKQGGESVVHHDSGYGIRTFGAYAALGYDWLRKAPGMTPELRRRVTDRLESWLTWYGRRGYLRDHPIANYYWGYLTTLAFSGLAVAGEDPRGSAWLEHARSELATRVLPAFAEHLRGGDWPEGWQYGEYVALEAALVGRAFEMGAGIGVVRNMRWLRETVTHHAHALLPDERSVYDGGTWAKHPARPSGLAMHAVALALDGVDDGRAAEARWLANKVLPPLERDYAWLAVLAERPGAPLRDPRVGARPSLHMAGPGLTFMRSDWSRSAVWASFKAGPRLTPDHQHKDEGHFELFRGSDALLVDGGDIEGGATINHNSLLIDDGGRIMTYTPNQGVWGTAVRTTRFGDDGRVVVASGDIAEAYAPACVRDGCADRALERLTRTMVFVRPDVLVIEDDIGLKSGDFGAVWAAHATRPPRVDGSLVRVAVGDSRADIQTLFPGGARTRILREPTPSGDGPHRRNQPWGAMWRIEVTSPVGDTDRRFLHWITARGAAHRSVLASPVQGEGVSGAAGAVPSGAVAVLFVRRDQAVATLPNHVAEVVLVGLAQGDRYDIQVSRGTPCTLRVQRSNRGAPVQPGGFLRAGACKKP